MEFQIVMKMRGDKQFRATKMETIDQDLLELHNKDSWPSFILEEMRPYIEVLVGLRVDRDGHGHEREQLLLPDIKKELEK